LSGYWLFGCCKNGYGVCGEHNELQRTFTFKMHHGGKPLEGAGDGAAGCAHMRQKEQ
jgi:hypothetical protein